MPIYEFYCPKNNKIYSFYARTLAQQGKTPRCPDNPAFPLERMLSSFAVKRRVVASTERPAESAIDDARMEAAMSEMEREFGGMDAENPDPRMLARMMRKLSGVAGEKMPERVEEMLSRMERGEDPEKLEAEYGDAMEEFDAAASGPGDETSDEKSGHRKHLKDQIARMRNRPVRDPALYEMSEFVD